MSRKEIDNNARMALNEFKYEMANELSINTLDASLIENEGVANTKNLVKTTIKRNKNKYK